MQLEKDPTVWQRFSAKDAFMRALTSSALMYEARAVLACLLYHGSVVVEGLVALPHIDNCAPVAAAPQQIYHGSSGHVRHRFGDMCCRQQPSLTIWQPSPQ
jgi:hypothetical protein